VIAVFSPARPYSGERAKVLNVSSKTRALAVEALQARTEARLADLAPIIKDLQAAEDEPESYCGRPE
jgi:hypothetical protein